MKAPASEGPYSHRRIYPSVYLFIFIYISLSLSIDLPIYLSIYQSIYLSICLSANLPICPIYLSICPIYLSNLIYPSIHLSNLSIYLSIYLSVYLWKACFVYNIYIYVCVRVCVIMFNKHLVPPGATGPLHLQFRRMLQLKPWLFNHEIRAVHG